MVSTAAVCGLRSSSAVVNCVWVRSTKVDQYGMFFACGIRCLADVSSVCPLLEQIVFNFGLVLRPNILCTGNVFMPSVRVFLQLRSDK